MNKRRKIIIGALVAVALAVVAVLALLTMAATILVSGA